jgi:hypothetical protein
MGGIVGDLLGTSDQADAAQKAAQQQSAAYGQGIQAQQKNFDYIKELLAPFVNSGTSANTQQGNISGLNGNDAQSKAIQSIQDSPWFSTLKSQGENSILQNASATGGLRGGNTELALSQFSPNLLQQLVQQQFSNLGGISAQGLSAGGSVAGAGTNTANALTNLYGAQGSALAGGTIAAGNEQANTMGGLLQIAGMASGFGGFGGLGSSLNGMFGSKVSGNASPGIQLAKF